MTITNKGAKEGCKNAECVVVDLRFGNLEFILSFPIFKAQK